MSDKWLSSASKRLFNWMYYAQWQREVFHFNEEKEEEEEEEEEQQDQEGEDQHQHHHYPPQQQKQKKQYFRQVSHLPVQKLLTYFGNENRERINDIKNQISYLKGKKGYVQLFNYLGSFFPFVKDFFKGIREPYELRSVEIKFKDDCSKRYSNHQSIHETLIVLKSKIPTITTNSNNNNNNNNSLSTTPNTCSPPKKSNLKATLPTEKQMKEFLSTLKLPDKTTTTTTTSSSLTTKPGNLKTSQSNYMIVIEEHFECAICMVSFKEPTVLSCCRKMCCKSCLDDCIKVSGLCPFCRTILSTQDEISEKPPNIIKNLIGTDIQVFCTLCKSDELIPKSRYKFHKKFQCKSSSSTTENICKDCNCSFDSLNELDSHKVICPNNLVYCLAKDIDCTWIGQSNLKSKHQTECPYVQLYQTIKQMQLDYSELSENYDTLIMENSFVVTELQNQLGDIYHQLDQVNQKNIKIQSDIDNLLIKMDNNNK
ncbi:hypothetical protein CYY_006296 [Polysphondylium violaceum]|uniref:RING-type domain-containing protein n=1 Tax=Polysphondylium violaceum TaxID=133409 RepID=A0A8J4PQR6_9MYCE|nr:hypothetical protein CYY_006296 [Polysphondylium violaceum]